MKTTTLLFICLLLTVGGQAQEAEKRPVWKVELAGALNNYSAWEVEPTITYLGSHSYLRDVLQAGVKVYFYKKGFLHSKLMVSDDMLSTVGSTNVDFRSFEHNFEVNAFMYDVETALEMKEIFLQDQRESTQIFLKNWVRRPWRQKAAESVVRLLAPLL